MKRGKPIIALLTVLFAAIAVVFCRYELGMRNFPFSVIVTTEDSQEEIRCVKLEGEYYVFLPSYAGENARICTNRVYDVFIEGQPLTENRPCEDFPVNTKLELFFWSAKNKGYETVTFVRSANVATMYIDVPSGNMDYIHEQKGNAEAASVRLYTEEGVLDYSGSAESLKGRGNATWWAEKKSYSLEMFQAADLLGIGEGQNWVLLSNAYDCSHIRNKVAYDTAAAGLAFTPDTEWVDLYLNGEYAGLYLLSERNEVHPERVQVPEESSFLVSLEIPSRLVNQNYPYVSTEKGLALRIHHTSLGEEKLQSLWQSVENAILAENGIDPISGKSWDELIDVDSWARKYLLEELFGNYDAGSVSQFFYCDLSEPAGKIYAGPIWDFDDSMKGNKWVNSNPRSFLANRAHFFSVEDAPLFYNLYQKKAFYTRVVELFDSVYEPLITELVEGGLWDYASAVSQAASADQLRWDTQDPAKETEAMVKFLGERLECFYDLWMNGAEYCRMELTSDGTLWSCWLVLKGDCPPQLPDLGEGQWYNAVTGEPLDVLQPVLENLMVHWVPE